MRASIYLKDASEKQINDLRDWVFKQGYTDIFVYKDVTRFRWLSNDKHLLRLYRDAEEHKFECIFVNSLKDFGFNESDTLLLIDGFLSIGVPLISRTDEWTTLPDEVLEFIIDATLERLEPDGSTIALMFKKHLKYDDDDGLGCL